MKRTFFPFICLALIYVGFMPLFGQEFTAEEVKTNLRSKAIHVVYDDSGSMIIDRNVYVDRWGQAKYAMEVFAVMLQENDTMRVYYMSDFIPAIGGNINAAPKITILGTEPADERVAKIHNTITTAHGTPFAPVIKAYNDLRNIEADEKWLVVLTDGEFEGNVDVDAFYSQKDSSIKIIHLAIGNDAETIRADPGRHIYFEHARNSNEILGRITAICNRIFNRNSLRFNETRREFNFDVPMQELLVFVQGADVRVNGIYDGTSTHSPKESVNVRYSDVPATNPEYRNNPNVVVSRDLTGVVAVFRNIPKGRYNLDITNAQTVEIYYKPDVAVEIRLYKRGKQVSTEDITEGNYQIRFGFVDENGRFFESELLGNVEYEATLQNDGQTINIKSGNTINIKEGNFTVYVQARFLDINTIENSITGNVLPPPTLIEILLDILKQFWYIFALLLALLLYWLLWGRKKRFPRRMASRPIIQEDINGNVVTRNGRFKIETKTIWLPFCAEKGTIKAVPTDKTLPKLKVRAKSRDTMELYNANDFSPERLRDAEVTISGRTTEGVGNSMEISCMSTIEVTYHGRDGNPNEVYTCFLERGNR